MLEWYWANSYTGSKAGVELGPDRQAAGSEVHGPGLEPRGGTFQNRILSTCSRTVPLSPAPSSVFPRRAQDSAGRISARVPNSRGESPAPQPLPWSKSVRCWGGDGGGGGQHDTAVSPGGVTLPPFLHGSLARSEGQVGVWAVLRGWRRKEVGTFESSGVPHATRSPCRLALPGEIWIWEVEEAEAFRFP